MRRYPPSPFAEKRAAAEWNEKHPIGTHVRYWPFTRDGEGRTGVTTTEARLVGGNTAVVWIDTPEASS